MDADERAEKIVKELTLYWGQPMFTKPNEDMIAAQIREAEEERVMESRKADERLVLSWRPLVEKARQEALEAAAKEVWRVWAARIGCDVNDIMKTIRALKDPA